MKQLLLTLTLLLLPITSQANSIDEVKRGGFLPYTTSPEVNKNVTALMVNSYNSIGDVGQIKGVVEANLFGPLVLNAGAVYYSDKDRFRPRVGLKLQLLKQDNHWLNGAIMVLYKPEGFTEAEGEIESILLLSRQFGNITAAVNFVYGTDFEAKEGDFEFKGATIYQASANVHVGVDTKLRVNVDPKPNLLYDLVAGPVVGYSFEHVTLLMLSGLSVLHTTTPTAGIIVLGGIGANF